MCFNHFNDLIGGGIGLISDNYSIDFYVWYKL